MTFGFVSCSTTDRLPAELPGKPTCASDRLPRVGEHVAFEGDEGHWVVRSVCHHFDDGIFGGRGSTRQASQVEIGIERVK